MRHIHLLVIACLLFAAIHFPAKCQIETDPLQGDFYSGVYSGRDAASHFFNPAACISTKGLSLYAAASTLYGLEGLHHLMAGVSLKTGKHAAGVIALRRYGDEIYSKQWARFAYGMQLNDAVQLGAGLNAVQVHIENYGSSILLQPELGAVIGLGSTCSAGIYFYNPLGKTKTDASTSRQLMLAEFSYRPEANIDLVAGLRMEQDLPPSVLAGFVYRPAVRISFRLGMMSTPFRWNAGLGYMIRRQLRANTALDHHPFLGWTPSISLLYFRGVEA